MAEGLAPNETRVENPMTSDVVLCSEEDDVEDEFAGIVALADLALRDESPDAGLKTLIESSPLPKTRAHVTAVYRFLREGPVP